MENFNLDILQKKTPYMVPENFFGEMQENVLKETIKQKERHPKVFRINFSAFTSIAATLVLIFGFAFLWKTNQTEISKPSDATDTISASSISKSNNTSVKDLPATTPSQKHEEVGRVSAQENISLAKTENAIAADNDDNYEQLLNSLTDEEIAELSKNSDQDIYLELYN